MSKLSKASSVYKASEETVLQLDCSVGGAAQTWGGVEKYLSEHKTSIVLFENVDSIDDAGDQDPSKAHVTNLDVVVQDFRELCLESQVILTDGALFGLPQFRPRYYVLGVSDAPRHFAFETRSIVEVFAVMRDLLKVCQRAPPCASELLLDDGHNLVEEELNRRARKGQPVTEYNVATGISSHKKIGIRWGATSVTPETSASPWFPTLANLQQNVLAYSQAEVSTVLCRDIGQGYHRVRYSKLGQNGVHQFFCQMPAQVVWVERSGMQPRLLLGSEALLVQGYPTAKIPNLCAGVSERLKQDIAGNMMASPIALAILQSFATAVDWQHVPQAATSSEADVQLAMSVFAVSNNSTADAGEHAGDDVPLRRPLRKLQRRS